MASIVRNSFYNSLGMGIYFIGMIVVTPMLINEMGDVQFGLFRLALFSIVGYSAILDMGMSNGILRVLANKIAVNDILAARKIIAISIYIFSVVSAMIAVMVFVLIIYFPAYVRTPQELVFPFRLLIAATGVYLVFSCFNTIFINIFVIKSRFDCVQGTKVLGRLVFMFAALLMMKVWGSPLIMMSISVVVITVAVFILSYFLTKRVWSDFGADFSNFDYGIFRQIVSFSSRWFLITLSGILIYSTTEIMVGRFAGLAAVAFYSVPILIGNQITTVITSVSYPIFSVAAELGAQKKSDEIVKLYRLTLSVSAFLFVCVIVPLIVFMRPLLTLWVNPQFAEVTNVAIVIVAGYFYVVIDYSTQAVLKATGKVNKICIYYISSAAIVLLTVFLILKYSDYGLMGVAVALSTVSIIRSVFILRDAMGQYNVPWIPALSGLVIKTIAAAVPGYALCLALSLVMDVNDIASLIFGLISGAGIASIFAFFITLDPMQRIYVKNFAVSKLQNLYRKKSGK